MAVDIVFATDSPPDHLLWRQIAAAVVRGRDARVVARETPDGWHVSLVAPDGFSTVAHPHTDGDFEIELRKALRAAGIRICLAAGTSL